MKICIRRGATQIGGSAVELTANNGHRIIIDLGLPLDAEENTADLLPQIAGLANKTDDLLALLISHPHQDHYALGMHIDQNIPVYMGKKSVAIMDVAKKHIRNAFAFEKTEHFAHNTPFQIGAFKITPYAMDHSAYDAYAFLIEADGKRLLYSGDFRSHGRNHHFFDSFIQNAPQNIDTLLLEGSCIGRAESDKYKSEYELEEEFTKAFAESKGLVIVQTSTQNIDRLATIYEACKKNNRTLVLSGYAGHLVWKAESTTLQGFIQEDVKKFHTAPTKHFEINLQTIEEAPEKYVMVLGGKMYGEFLKSNILNEDVKFIYSLWNGYKEMEYYKNKLAFFKEKKVQIQDLHTSGHADIPTLTKFVEALQPNKLVPIHTFQPKRFLELFPHVSLFDDNVEFDC